MLFVDDPVVGSASLGSLIAVVVVFGDDSRLSVISSAFGTRNVVLRKCSSNCKVIKEGIAAQCVFKMYSTGLQQLERTQLSCALNKDSVLTSL